MTVCLSYIIAAIAVALLLVGGRWGGASRRGDSLKPLLQGCALGVVARLMARYVGSALAALIGLPYGNAALSSIVYAVVVAALCAETARLWALDYTVGTQLASGRMPSSMLTAMAVGVGFAECMIAEQLFADVSSATIGSAATTIVYLWALLLIAAVMGFYHDLARFVARRPYRMLALAVPMCLHAVVAALLPAVHKAIVALPLPHESWTEPTAIALFSAFMLAVSLVLTRLLSRRASRILVERAVSQSHNEGEE